MARIKVTDLPKDVTVSKEEMKKISGGVLRYSPLLVTKTSTDFDARIPQLAACFDKEWCE